MLRQLLATKHPHAAHTEAEGLSLRRTLGPWGLTALGIGAVIGGGIFVITGQAAANHAGPAIMLSFVLAAICCTFCALAYAEFAAMVPVSGSAYTYTYATLGELTAWFIGWMLVLEYGVSASAVAVSWTGYLLSLLEHANIYLPEAFVSAPLDAQLRPTGAIANVPAALLVLLLTWLCYVGIRKSSAMNMAMVVLKTGLIVLVMNFVHHVWLAVPLLIIIGGLSGYFVVPMNALLQHRGHILMGAGHSIAVQNFNENLSILMMTGLYYMMVKIDLSIYWVITLFGLFVSSSMLLVKRRHQANQREYDDVIHLDDNTTH